MKQNLQQLSSKVEEIFHYLHTHPEVSWQEYETTDYIAALLEQEGFHPVRFKHCTGLYVDVGEGAPYVGIRADMDALWQEVEGVWRANHSCGHDGHMTMAIGVLLLLKRLPNFKGTIRVFFQPAEEKAAGALKVLEEGIIDPLSYLFGVHVRPIQEMEDGTYSPALFHGATCALIGTIIGEDAHAARPHLGQNAIEIGAAIINALGMIHHDPMVPASYKMTKFHAGGDAANIIPGKAEFSIDVRAQQNEVMESILMQVKYQIDRIAEVYNVTILLEEASSIVAADVHAEAEQLLAQAIVQSVGEAYLKPPIHTPGGEDFHYYAVHRPKLKSTMLGLGCGVTPGLHHPYMTFNENRLVTGIEILTTVALLALQNAKPEEAEEYARISSSKTVNNK